ncbi:hypothetical protein [Caulobacter sp. B11]|uniref:hypothetical protein n=1 Tax=Caulobacter sp. B11 TaxID=2048899 RepID=UPI0035149E20
MGTIGRGRPGAGLRVAVAQDAADLPSQPQPYSGNARPLPGLVTTPPTALYGGVAESDAANLRSALNNARDAGAVRAALASLQDPVARKIALWALIDANAETMSFFELDAARRDLNGWPRAGRREGAPKRPWPPPVSTPNVRSPGSAAAIPRPPTAPWPWPRPIRPRAARRTPAP